MITRLLPKSCYSKKKIKKIEGIVIHFMSNTVRSPNDPFKLDDLMGLFKEYKVSAHYMIDREGEVIQLVPLPYIAWHAGRSRMNGRDRCNKWTLGIELMGGTDFPYTDDQIAALKQLMGTLIIDYKIPLESIQGHDDVRSAWNTAYPKKKGAKKYDPGAHFPWDDVIDSLKYVDNGHNEVRYLNNKL